MNKRILVISVQSGTGSLGRALTEQYIQGLQASKQLIEVIFLDRLAFDPVLREAYRHSQALEADLQRAQQLLVWAEHITLVYPVWWGSVPAVLKGFIDRVFLPKFAFQYQSGKAFPQPLLMGKTAQLIVTMDTPVWYFKWIYQAPAIRHIKNNTLEFCGIKPVRVYTIGPIISASLIQRQRWLAQAYALGKKA